MRLIGQFYIELFIDTVPVVNKSFQLIDISAGNQKCKCAEYNHGKQEPTIPLLALTSTSFFVILVSERQLSVYGGETVCAKVMGGETGT